MRLLRRFAALSLSCVAAAVSVGVLAAPAHAEDGFTYWGYYHHTDGEWVASETGADGFTPEDGSIEGYHYATTAAMPTRPPRTDLTFDEVCADAEAGAEQKRVAVAVDYGSAEEAPDGAEPPAPEALCAVVPAGANGQQVLDSVTDVRVEDGLTCGINGYPSSGCSTTVTDAQIPESEDPVEFAVPASETEQVEGQGAGSEDGGVPWSLVGIGVLVLMIAAAGVLVARRRA